VRVDWFTPDGLPSWGDGRLTILAPDGYIELRKNLDIEAAPAPITYFWPIVTARATSIAARSR